MAGFSGPDQSSLLPTSYWPEQLHDHTWLQGRLGNVVQLCACSRKKMGLVVSYYYRALRLRWTFILAGLCLGGTGTSLL